MAPPAEAVGRIRPSNIMLVRMRPTAFSASAARASRPRPHPSHGPRPRKATVRRPPHTAPPAGAEKPCHLPENPAIFWKVLTRKGGPSRISRKNLSENRTL